MEYKIYFINQARNYQMIMDEIDAAYFEDYWWNVKRTNGGMMNSGGRYYKGGNQ